MNTEIPMGGRIMKPAACRPGQALMLLCFGHQLA